MPIDKVGFTWYNLIKPINKVGDKTLEPGEKIMIYYFEQLVRANFRFGRM